MRQSNPFARPGSTVIPVPLPAPVAQPPPALPPANQPEIPVHQQPPTPAVPAPVERPSSQQISSDGSSFQDQPTAVRLPKPFVPVFLMNLICKAISLLSKIL